MGYQRGHRERKEKNECMAHFLFLGMKEEANNQTSCEVDDFRAFFFRRRPFFPAFVKANAQTTNHNQFPFLWRVRCHHWLFPTGKKAATAPVTLIFCAQSFRFTSSIKYSSEEGKKSVKGAWVCDGYLFFLGHRTCSAHTHVVSNLIGSFHFVRVSAPLSFFGCQATAIELDKLGLGEKR